MSALRKQYGSDDKAKRIFYAMANKKGEKPGGKRKSKARRKRKRSKR